MNDRLTYLWEQYLHDRCTEAEYWEMVDLLRQYPAASSSFIDAELNNASEHPETISYILSPEKAKTILSNIFVTKQEAPVKRIGTWKRWLAAASILFILGAATYFIFSNRSAETIPVAQSDNDVKAPAKTKATLTLADGRIILLDTADKGFIVANASKINDEAIVYENSPTKVEYHTLTVPRGSKPIQLQLADGSEIWLNVGSSIRYPTAFTEAERNVTITGEAYFEIVKNEKKKFIVSVNDVRVEVLGTHFNINAYDDESTMNTTLLEGSVRVQSTVGSQQSALLKPGQQVKWPLDLIAIGSPFTISHSPDLIEVMAWKNGIFRFKGADISSVMRQLARWYDIDVKYKGKVPEGHLSGIINRNVNLSEVLKMLELSDVKFILDGRQLTVLE